MTTKKRTKTTTTTKQSSASMSMDNQGNQDPATAAADSVQALFKDGLKADGSINGRSTLGAHFRAVRAGLQAGKVGEEVLARMIGLDLLLLRVVEAEIIAHPETVIKDGRLSQTITSDLAGLRTSLRQNIKEYDARTKAAGAGGGGGGRRPGALSTDFEKTFFDK